MIFPLVAFAALLFFDAAHYSVTLLEFQIISDGFPAFVAKLSVKFFNTAFAVNLQSVLASTICMELTFSLPSSALAAQLLFDPIHNSMTIVISESLSQAQCGCLRSYGLY